MGDVGVVPLTVAHVAEALGDSWSRVAWGRVPSDVGAGDLYGLAVLDLVGDSAGEVRIRNLTQRETASVLSVPFVGDSSSTQVAFSGVRSDDLLSVEIRPLPGSSRCWLISGDGATGAALAVSTVELVAEGSAVVDAPTFTITTQPESITLTEDGSSDDIAWATDAPVTAVTQVYTYETWVSFSGAVSDVTSGSVTIPASLDNDGLVYRWFLSDGVTSQFTDEATVTVTPTVPVVPLTIDTQPASVNALAGSSPVTVTWETNIDVSWILDLRLPGETVFTEIEGGIEADTGSLVITPTSVVDGYAYRWRLTDPVTAVTLTTDIVTVTIAEVVPMTAATATGTTNCPLPSGAAVGDLVLAITSTQPLVPTPDPVWTVVAPTLDNLTLLRDYTGGAANYQSGIKVWSGNLPDPLPSDLEFGADTTSNMQKAVILIRGRTDLAVSSGRSGSSTSATFDLADISGAGFALAVGTIWNTGDTFSTTPGGYTQLVDDAAVFAALSVWSKEGLTIDETPDNVTLSAFDPWSTLVITGQGVSAAETTPEEIDEDLLLQSVSTFPDVAEGAFTKATFEAYMGRSGYTNNTSYGYSNMSVVNGGDLRIKFDGADPAPTFGMTYRTDIDPGDEVWMACDMFVEDISGFADEYWLSGKLGLGIYGGSKPGGGNQTDDGGSVRTVWHTDSSSNGGTLGVRNSSPCTIGGYIYAPQYLGNSYGVTRFGPQGTTVVDPVELPIGAWYRVILGVDKGTVGNADGWLQIWVDKGDSDGAVKALDISSFKFQETGEAWDWSEFRFEPFFGGNTSAHRPSRTTYRRYRDFRVGLTKAGVS